MMCASSIQQIARGFLVYEITESAKVVGLVSASTAVPILILSLFGGAFADRFDRKFVIQIGQTFSLAITLFVAITIMMDMLTWYHLLATSILQGVMWSFLSPARLAIIPEMVDKRLISSAMAIYGAGFSGSILVAPAIGGLLYSLIGPERVYYFVSMLTFVAVAFTYPITTSEQQRPKNNRPILTDIKSGLAYIWNSNLVMVMLIISALSALLVMPFKYLLPVFIVQVYQEEAGAFGILISVMGLGALIGSLVFASLGKNKRGLMLFVGSYSSAIALLMVAAIPFYYPAIGIMILLGIGDAGRRVLNQTLIMEQVENEYQGRVMSVYTMLYGFMPLGVLPAGIAMDLVGGRITIFILGLTMLTATTFLLATQKQLRILQ